MFTHTRSGRGRIAISWGQWWFWARRFEADSENWVFDPFLVERILLPLRLRSATAHVWTHVMICVEANFPPASARVRLRMCERTFTSTWLEDLLTVSSTTLSAVSDCKVVNMNTFSFLVTITRCSVEKFVEISQELCASYSSTWWEASNFCQATNIYLIYYMLRLAGYNIFVEFMANKYLEGWLLNDVNSLIPEIFTKRLVFRGLAFPFIKMRWWQNPLDCLLQDCSNSSALAMEFMQSFTKPLILSLSWEFLFRQHPIFISKQPPEDK